jgi:hypothetical protein
MPTWLLFLAPLFGSLGATILGLGVWRYQLIAQRRYQVAEQALLMTDKLISAINSIRSATSQSIEEGQRNPDGIPFQPWIAVSQQIQSSETYFEDFKSISNTILLHFGESTAKPFHEIRDTYQRICKAHVDIYYRSTSDRMYPTEDSKNKAQLRKEIIEDQGVNDPISSNIKLNHEKIRILLGRHIRPSYWRLFIPNLD